jgi:hypothetical protein
VIVAMVVTVVPATSVETAVAAVAAAAVAIVAATAAAARFKWKNKIFRCVHKLLILPLKATVDEMSPR